MKLLFKILILFALSVGEQISLAQQKQIDSLSIVLKKYQSHQDFQKDTTYVNTLATYARYYRTLKPDSSLFFSQKSLALAQNLNMGNLIATLHFDIGFLHYNQGRYKQALENYNTSSKIATELDNKKMIAQSLNGIAVIDKNQGRYQEAMEKYQKALIINEQISNLRGASIGWNNIAILYMDQGNLSESLEASLKAFKINENLKDKKGMGNNLIATALVYKEQQKYEEALTTYQQALKLLGNDINLEREVSTVLLNIGNIYNFQKKYEAALEVYQKALEIKERLKDKRNMGVALHNIADIHKSIDKPVIAIDFYRQALKIREELVDKDGICTSNMGLSLVAIDLKDLDGALEYAQKALKIAHEMSKKNAIREANRILSTIYETKGEAKLALQHYKQAIVYADSINNSEVARKTLQIQTRYEFEKKETILKAEQAKKVAEFAAKEQILKIEQTVQKQTYKAQEAVLKAEQAQKEAEYKVRETLFGLEKKQRENDYKSKEAILKIQQAKKEIENAKKIAQQRWIIFSSLLGLLISLFIAYLVVKNRNKIQTAYKKLTLANTEIQQQKEEIKTQSEVLQALVKTKQMLTDAIIHDLKTPLSVIIHKNKDEEIAQASRQMQNMLLNILEVEQLENVNSILSQKQENINRLVKNSLSQIDFLAKKKNIEIKNLIYENTTVLVDNVLVERVLVNIFSNSIRHINSNGKIIIQRSNKQPQAHLIGLEIIDNGLGIPKNQLPFIFDKYFQANATMQDKQENYAYRSSGLGLTFCKMVVEAHGGEIWAESEVGKGTLIYLSLPIAQKQRIGQQEILTYQEKTTHLLLSLEEKLYLAPFIKELQTKETVEYSVLKKILKKIDENKSEAILAWKTQLANAIATQNESEFKKIVQDDDSKNSDC